VDVFLVIVAVLLAILVGAAIPVLLQLRATLRSAQTFLDTTAPRLESALEEIRVAAERINTVAGEIEGRVGKLAEFTDEVGKVGRQIRRVGHSLRTAVNVGVAVGPALTAGLRAFFSRPQGAEEPALPADSGNGSPAPADGDVSETTSVRERT
jgi:uncharacterized protein YoxC